MDGVHIVDEGLHRLVYASHRLVHGVLLGTLAACQSVKGLLDIVNQRFLVHVAVVFAVELLQCLQFLDIAHADVGCQVEVEGRDSLSAVHLVLGTLHRDTGQHRCRLDTAGRARGSVSGDEAALKDMIQGVLHTGERLRGVVVLVVDVQIVMGNGVAGILREQVVVDEGLCGLRGELHHHACRRVGVHVSILAGDIVVLDVDDIEEHLARLGFSGHTALVAVGDVFLGHVLAARLHQLQLHEVLDFLHRHPLLATLGDAVGYLIEQSLVLTLVGMEHGLTDGGHHFLFVESHNAPVALHYCLNHIECYFGFIGL